MDMTWLYMLSDVGELEEKHAGVIYYQQFVLYHSEAVLHIFIDTFYITLTLCIITCFFF